MNFSIVTNMGHQKKPWDDVPVEVLIEYERKKKEQLEDHREQLHAPPPSRHEFFESEEKKEHKHVIVIKL